MNASALRVLTLVLAASPPAAAQGLLGGLLGPPGSPPVLDGQHEILVLMEPGFSVVPIASSIGATIVGQIPGLEAFALELPPTVPPVALEALAQALAQLPTTATAETNRSVEAPESESCTTFGGEVGNQQCTIGFVDGNPSVGTFESQAWLDVLGVEAAQQYLSGAPTIVAVIDSGVDPSHPVLAGRLAADGYDLILGQPGGWAQADGIDNDGDGYVDEGSGHGTHVAGTVVLINPDALILPYRAMDTEGNGTAFHLAEAVWRALSDGADVINLSVSMNQPSTLVGTVLTEAINSGVDVYASAGNTGANDVLFPASLSAEDSTVPPSPDYPSGIIAVAAVDDDDVKADFSAWGAEVDVCAPGVAVYGPLPGGGYAWWSGTSMATAVASGVGSLVRSVLAGGGSGTAVELLLAHSASIDAENPAYAGLLGSGRLSAYLAAQAAAQL